MARILWPEENNVVSLDSVRRRQGAKRGEVDYAQEKVDLTKKLSADPENIHLLEELAIACQGLGDSNGAFAVYNHILTIDPENPYIRLQIAYLYLDSCRFKNAEPWLRSAVAYAHREGPGEVHRLSMILNEFLELYAKQE